MCSLGAIASTDIHGIRARAQTCILTIAAAISSKTHRLVATDAHPQSFGRNISGALTSLVAASQIFVNHNTPPSTFFISNTHVERNITGTFPSHMIASAEIIVSCFSP